MPYGIISNLTRKSDYLMSYFHPSDFDPLQPQMPQLSRMRQFKNRVALKGAYTKFVKYITTVQRNYPIGSVDLNRNHSSDVLV